MEEERAAKVVGYMSKNSRHVIPHSPIFMYPHISEPHVFPLFVYPTHAMLHSPIQFFSYFSVLGFKNFI